MNKSTTPFINWHKYHEYLWQIAITGIATFFVLQAWRFNWYTPFNYEGDTVFELVLIKSMIQNGWTWFIPQLSAPMQGFEAIAFPQNTTFSFAIMKVISFFTSSPGLILNSFWVLSIILTSVTCHFALRSLKVPTPVTLALSTLYALLPFALMRNTNHLALTYIFTPIISAYAIAVACNFLHEDASSIASETSIFHPLFLWASCIAIGLDYIYTAYFSCFFLLMAAVLAFFKNRDLRTALKPIAIPMLLIIGFSLLNLMPTFFAWHQYGAPPNMGYKSLSDVETYGLKIRHLLSSPALLELFPSEIKIDYPLENENRSAMLGIFGGFGFICATVYGLLAPKKNLCVLWGAGALTIVGTLLSTVGGFGAVFSAILGADIRAYNRVSPFLAFFSFFVIAYLLTNVLIKIQRALQTWKVQPLLSNALIYSGLFTLMTLALVDQSYAIHPFLKRYTHDLSQMMEEKSFVEKIEFSYPQTRQIYQLPERPFPVDAGVERMKPYDHARAYIWSYQAQWSWPNFSHQNQAWLEKIGTQGSKSFLTKLVESGFDAIWFDKEGYDAASATKMQKQLETHLGAPKLSSAQGRYTLYSLINLKEHWIDTTSPQERYRAREHLLDNPIGIDFGRGFYPKEFLDQDQTPHRWAQKNAVIWIFNFSAMPQTVEFRSLLSYNNGGKLTLHADNQKQVIYLKDGKMELTLPLKLAPNSKTALKFKYEGPAVLAPDDPRAMFLSFSNPKVIQIH